MRVAYFSPLPPSRTGIAAYSHSLVSALSDLCDITVFTATRDASPIPGVEVVEFPRDPLSLKSLAAFDQILYHMGNNPWFHLEIRGVAELFPGSICLHDVVLYYLAAGRGKGGLLKELFLADPEHALRNLRAIQSACPDGDLLRYATPSLHPCAKGVLETTSHVIVHNESSAVALRELGFHGHVDVIPMIDYADPDRATCAEDTRELKLRLGFGADDFVLGAFGFIGPTKRLEKVLEALAAVRASGEVGVKMLIVGEGDPLDEQIRALGLEASVRQTGFVDDGEFRRHLAAVDAVANLRYPSHGESSASLVQAMSCGKPCFVTNHGSFAELPDEAVVKIGLGESEVDELVRGITLLARDDASAERIGAAARRHARDNHAPHAVARRLMSALSNQPSRRQADVVSLSAQQAGWTLDYFERRARDLLP